MLKDNIKQHNVYAKNKYYMETEHHDVAQEALEEFNVWQQIAKYPS